MPEDKKIKVISWFNMDWSHCIEEVHSHAKHANQPGRHLTLLHIEEDGDEMNVSVVYEGKEATDEEVAAAFRKAWLGDEG